MTKKQKTGCLIDVISFVTTTPIWYYLLYQILIRVEATELMMFLFWIYVPLGIFLAIVSKFIKTDLIGDVQKNDKEDKIFGRYYND